MPPRPAIVLEVEKSPVIKTFVRERGGYSLSGRTRKWSASLPVLWMNISGYRKCFPFHPSAWSIATGSIPGAVLPFTSISFLPFVRIYSVLRRSPRPRFFRRPLGKMSSECYVEKRGSCHSTASLFDYLTLPIRYPDPVGRRKWIGELLLGVPLGSHGADSWKIRNSVFHFRDFTIPPNNASGVRAFAR